MKASEINIELKKRLMLLYDEREAGNIAEMVLENVTGHNRVDRLVINDALSEEKLQHLKAIEERLLQHEPVQYILGETWFCGMKLNVDKNVLIPRPETEELVEWIVETVKKWPEPNNRNYKILDVGTGSGCIAIALQKKLPAYFETWACDKSDGALTVARKNADDQKALVDFIAMDFLDEKQRNQLPHVDIVVSNPPYIPLAGKELMKENVINYEPELALFVPDDDPLQFYKALAAFGKEKLQKDGWLFAEIHEDMGNEVFNFLKNENYNQVVLKKDLQGKNRFVRANNLNE